MLHRDRQWGHPWAHSAGTRVPVGILLPVFSLHLHEPVFILKTHLHFPALPVCADQSSFPPYQNYFSPMCVAFHQAPNFPRCLVAQLNTIAQPFSQPLVRFLWCVLIPPNTSALAQVFLWFLRQPKRVGDREEPAHPLPGGVKRHRWRLQETPCCAFLPHFCTFRDRGCLRSNQEPRWVQDLAANCTVRSVSTEK